ncbi:hypothetical protein [Sorangium sp. So ce1335]|uniref:hypothetical protein n=1 Tax=Sorangium sp. So ce1335 TaxID=3133335 RepID=UPI003F60DD5A
MRNRYSEGGSYVTGQASGPDSGWIVMAMDDIAAKGIAHSGLFSWRRPTLTPVKMKMFRTAFAAWLPDSEEAVFVGEDGQCAVVGPGGQIADELVTASPRAPQNTGPLRSGARIGDQVVVVGMQRQVYRRERAGVWVDLMRGLPDAEPGKVAGFEAVAAVQPSELYAAGWDGELFCFDGQAWRKLDSPTDRIITGLGVDADGAVWGCGRNGLVLRGRGDDWRLVPEAACPDDLWSIAPFQGRVFAASLRRLYCIEGGKVEPLDLETLGASSFGVLSALGDTLWSVGAKDVLSFDGQRWSRVA